MQRLRRVVGSRLALFLFSVLLLGLAAYAAVGAIWPSQGSDTLSDGSLVLDKSHAQDGYISARIDGADDKYKLRIEFGDTTYTYDLSVADGMVVFPLQSGSGSYVCTLYRNVGGKNYKQAGKVTLSVKLTDENNAYLCPSQYVSYAQDSPAVLKAGELCAGITDDMDKVRAIREFIKDSFSYDYIGSLSAKEFSLSSVDDCYNSRKGLCQDLAVLTACMLRSQGIPTQLVIGYAGSNYHAWNRVYIDGKFRRLDLTAELAGMGKDMEYTPERYY